LLLLLAATLPLGALTTSLVLQADLPGTGWVVAAAALLVVALGLTIIVARRIADVASAVTRAARAIGHGDTPALGPFPIQELDELAHAVAAAGTARRDTENRLRAAETRLADRRAAAVWPTGSETVAVEVLSRDGTSSPEWVRSVHEKLEKVPGVSRVIAKDSRDSRARFTVESLKDSHVRPELARTVIESGWQLNELHGMGLSLEEIFLELTASKADISEPAPQATAEEA